MLDELITFENCKNNYGLRQYLLEHKNCYAISLRKYKQPMYQEEHYYWSTYWNSAYKVIDVVKEKIRCDNGYIYTRLISVTVQWMKDGNCTTHCTQLHRQDYELIFN